MLDEQSIGLQLAAARWLLYLSSFLLIGVGGARLVIGRADDPAIAALRPLAERRLRLVRVAAACLLSVAAGVTLVAQVHAWFGPGLAAHGDDIRVMLSDTPWGHGWVSTARTAGLVLGLAVLALIAPRLDLIAGTLAALLAAVAVPFTGHGSAHGAPLWWTHAAHVFGGSLWLGTLAVLVPVTWTSWRPGSATPSALSALLARFTPTAIAGASIAVLSGTVLTAEHVVTVSAALSTDYGRTLIAKLMAVFAIAAIGWLNWRTSRGPIDDRRARRALRTRAIIEAAIALVVVLALTAVLAGLAPAE